MTVAPSKPNPRGGQAGYLLFLLASILFAIFFIMPIV
jgi:multiple sugar transport system permease protein